MYANIAGTIGNCLKDGVCLKLRLVVKAGSMLQGAPQQVEKPLTQRHRETSLLLAFISATPPVGRVFSKLWIGKVRFSPYTALASAVQTFSFVNTSTATKAAGELEGK